MAEEQQQLDHLQVLSISLDSQQLLDQRVICSLLCCSSKTSVVVHAKYRGQLHARVGAAECASHAERAAHGNNVSNWLSHNATLLQSLTVLGPTPSEADITRGLAAAAAAAASSTAAASGAAEVTSQLQTLGLDATTAAAAQATAAAAASGPGPFAHSTTCLPLQSLTCHVPFTGTSLCSLSIAASLRHLLTLTNFHPSPQDRQGLAALKTLQRLALATGGVDFPLHRLSAAWQHLTALTCLDLDPDGQGDIWWRPLDVHPIDVQDGWLVEGT